MRGYRQWPQRVSSSGGHPTGRLLRRRGAAMATVQDVSMKRGTWGRKSSSFLSTTKFHPYSLSLPLRGRERVVVGQRAVGLSKLSACGVRNAATRQPLLKVRRRDLVVIAGSQRDFVRAPEETSSKHFRRSVPT